MTRDDIRQELATLLTAEDLLGPTFDTSLVQEDISLKNNLPMDSFRLLIFLVKIEKRFNLSINPSELPITALDRLAYLIDYLEDKIV